MRVCAVRARALIINLLHNLNPQAHRAQSEYNNCQVASHKLLYACILLAPICRQTFVHTSYVKTSAM